MMEWGEERAVVVFSLGAPRQRLMGWFLRDCGIGVELADTLDQALELAAMPSIRVAVVNSTSPLEEIAAAVAAIRDARPDLRILVLHGGSHHEGEIDIPADLCIHDVGDPDHLVEVVKAALNDDVPAGEPHEAAEELV
jgi:hypothetical protein